MTLHFIDQHAHDDDLSRREWMRIGTLASTATFFGTGHVQAVPSRPAPDAVGAFGRAKRVILFWLTGGPPQQETWDPKPEGRVDLRGPFGTIPSRTPGLDVCELMPKTALLTDQIAVLRAVVTKDSSHSSSGYQMLTGVPHVPLSRESVTAKAPNLYPSLGSIVRYLHRDKNGLPSTVAVPEHIWNDGNFPWPGQDAGFLGRQYDPWLLHCDPSSKDFRIPDLSFPESISQVRFDRRRSLLAQVERHVAAVGESAASTQYDEGTRQAINLLTASRAREAFDINLESEATRDRYGRSRYAQSVLLARRLVETGVSLVRINWTRIKDKANQGGWDTHSKNAESLKSFLMPMMDQAYSALLEDLKERGMLDDTLVVWIGEFGRTPKINANAGRDHWGHCFSMAFAGAGVRGGTVHGSSDRDAAYAVDGMVTGADVASTIFHCLGYGPETEVHDTLNRPFPISRGRVIREVF
ncbi:MAG: DUF1501 domain-containing protein [Planctomycetota bacterium]|nr:DUF1501 domain-containing protein [Planctomycetota bacterium]